MSMYTRNNRTVVPVTSKTGKQVHNRFGHALSIVRDTVFNHETKRHEQGEIMVYHDAAGRCVLPSNNDYDLKSYVRVERRESDVLHEKRQKGYWL